jgi:hypothetical protein
VPGSPGYKPEDRAFSFLEDRHLPAFQDFRQKKAPHDEPGIVRGKKADRPNYMRDSYATTRLLQCQRSAHFSIQRSISAQEAAAAPQLA